MLWWFLTGCAAQLASVPMDASHIGAFVEPPAFPLVPVQIEATDRSCRPHADALRFAMVVHADQIVLPEASLRLDIVSCGAALTEAVRIVSIEPDGQQHLEALLTGRADLELHITREDQILDELSFSVVRVAHQEWLAGGQYPWRGELLGLLQRDLVEKVESALIAPHPALRPRRDDPQADASR
ncbi:MAG: hypothetical protein AAFV53_07020 [Myxococcota bacterium]